MNSLSRGSRSELKFIARFSAQAPSRADSAHPTRLPVCYICLPNEVKKKQSPTSIKMTGEFDEEIETARIVLLVDGCPLVETNATVVPKRCRCKACRGGEKGARSCLVYDHEPGDQQSSRRRVSEKIPLHQSGLLSRHGRTANQPRAARGALGKI